MEGIIELLQSFSTSAFSTPSAPSVKESAATADAVKSVHADPHHTMLLGPSNVEALPAEILQHILAFLPPVSLASLSRTCRLLRSHALNDLLWMTFVRNAVPGPGELESPSPARSWRDLYIAHHPYWFLVQKKIWFADVQNNGLLILARYNSQNGCIEAFRVLAEHGDHKYETWAYNHEVIIHTFNPRVRLWLDDPVIQLGFDKEKYDTKNRLQKETAMQTGKTHGICSMISLCRPILKTLQVPAMALWPPAIIPARERVRNASATKFRTEEHRPQTLDVMSDHAFRIRKWLDFSNLMQPLNAVRMGEEVMTFSTLLEKSYMPTREKPWQGIWVGDYSGHGCEFLLVLQRDVSSPMALSRTPSTGSLPRGMVIATADVDMGLQDSDRFQYSVESLESQRVVPLDHAAETAGPSRWQPEDVFGNKYDKEVNGHKNARDGDPAARDSEASFIEAPSGRLEAIKLTGDINVPRGEYTWIAEDIGPDGLIRVANEQMFAGARTVKSWGHIAGREYRLDRFISSQLIMISHNSLAQYWEVSRAYHSPPGPCPLLIGSAGFWPHLILQESQHRRPFESVKSMKLLKFKPPCSKSVVRNKTSRVSRVTPQRTVENTWRFPAYIIYNCYRCLLERSRKLVVSSRAKKEERHSSVSCFQQSQKQNENEIAKG